MKVPIRLAAFAGLLVALLLLANLSVGQPARTFLRQFNLDHGLPSNHVYCVLQDHAGYIWMGTDNGVVKYDGYSFRTFTTADGLPSNDVWMLREDSRHRMWLSSITNGFGFIKDDAFHYIKFDSVNSTVYPAYQSEIGGDYYLVVHGGATKGVWVYREKRDVMEKIPTGKAVGVYLYQGNCYFSTDSLAYQISIRNPLKTLKRTGILPRENIKYLISRMTQTGIKHTWSYIPNDSIVYMHNIDSSVLQKIHLSDFGAGPGERIRLLYPSGAHYELLTTRTWFLIDSNLKVVASEKLDRVLPANMPVYNRLVDSKKQVWYSTSENGSILRRDIPAYWSHIKNMGSKGSLVGADKNALIFWNQSREQLYRYASPENQRSWSLTSRNDVSQINIINDSLYFIATSAGVTVLNVNSGRVGDFFDSVHDFYIRDASIGDTYFKGIHKIDENIIRDNFKIFKQLVAVNDKEIYATWPGGLLHLLRDDDRKTIILNGVANEKARYTSIMRYLQHIVIAINYKRIFIYNTTNRKYIILNENDLRLLGYYGIKNVIPDAYGNIFVQDDEKIVILKPFKSFSSKALPTTFTVSDAQITLWNHNVIVTGAFGLAAMAYGEPFNSAARFKIATNVWDSLYRHAAALKVLDDGNAFVSTDKGVFNVNITNLLHNGSSDDGDVFKITVVTSGSKNLHVGDTIVIPNKTPEITFDAINFMGSGTVNFFYTDERSNVSTSNTTGNFFLGDLGAGEYRSFSIRVQDDNWKSKTLHGVIYRQPQWFQTQSWRITFWVAGILALGLFGFFIAVTTKSIVSNRLKKHEQMTELELQAIYAQINPHFVFNTLGTAQYFIQKKDTEKAYDHVSKFARVLRGYLKSSQERYTTLESEINLLKGYIELQQERFEERFEFDISVDNKLPAKNLLIPSLLLQPLVENAINHGLFHKKEKGLLKISFLQGKTHDEMICVIEDNGVGRIRAKEIRNAGSMTEYESYGTKLTQRLIDVFERYESMNIHILYTDRELPETGTIVTLKLEHLRYVS